MLVTEAAAVGFQAVALLSFWRPVSIRGLALRCVIEMRRCRIDNTSTNAAVCDACELELRTVLSGR
jgi:hypothetical protein